MKYLITLIAAVFAVAVTGCAHKHTSGSCCADGKTATKTCCKH